MVLLLVVTIERMRDTLESSDTTLNRLLLGSVLSSPYCLCDVVGCSLFGVLNV